MCQTTWHLPLRKKASSLVYQAKSLLVRSLFHDFGGNTAQEVHSGIFKYVNNKLAQIKILKQAILGSSRLESDFVARKGKICS